MATIVKTISEVTVSTSGFSPLLDILYFEIVGEQRQDYASFKGQIGSYSYVIKVMCMDNGVLVDANKLYKNVSPIIATYKLSTWKTLFGHLTPNQIEAQKAQLMIQEIGNPKSGWGIHISNLEEYLPVTEE